MQTIVFIGSNKSGTSREALITSTEMGYYTVLLTDRKKFIQQRDEFPEVQRMMFVENLFEESNVFSIVHDLEQEGKQICAIISFIDPFVSYAGMLSQAWGFGRGNLSIEALSVIEDKNRFRSHLKGLPVSPRFSVIPFDEPIDKLIKEFEGSFPVILKSPVSNGSKDVLLVHTFNEMREGFQLLKRRFPNQAVLMEEYLIGPQYLIEVMVVNGEISIIAVIEQEILNGQRFIITGYQYPAILSMEENETLEHAVISIIRELELINGTCHLEMRNVNDQWKLIEINPRMSGGAMNRIIQEGTGMNLVKETIKLFLGIEPNLEKSFMKFVYTKYLVVEAKGKLIKVTGKNRALKHEGIKEVFVKPKKGTVLREPQSMGDRYAYVIAVSDTEEGAKFAAITAASEIKFYLEPL
ncbi:ATP-grasp domain-containing protein [Bacillus sp. FJAT-29814]|uniref:ATP-grasp domain-containing protein n=1 Tax=Bacillus sp. FJAT-29814 TaxID=1729688 RepID=UPI0008305651|nr:ATP-grasp domain-containing protein [Bacillus sp. FJAT-29814]